jgi:hypothetical protein
VNDVDAKGECQTSSQKIIIFLHLTSCPSARKSFTREGSERLKTFLETRGECSGMIHKK